MRLPEEKLIAQYDYWGEHPAYPLTTWKYAIADNDTRLGYWAWVWKQMQEDEDDETQVTDEVGR